MQFSEAISFPDTADGVIYSELPSGRIGRNLWRTGGKHAIGRRSPDRPTAFICRSIANFSPTGSVARCDSRPTEREFNSIDKEIEMRWQLAAFVASSALVASSGTLMAH